MCWETHQELDLGALAIDLSSTGLRLERPYVGGRTQKMMPLQIEVPGIDEIMWARGETCFDTLVAVDGPRGGPLGLVRRTGYRIVLAAARDLRLLREFVFETYRMTQVGPV